MAQSSLVATRWATVLVGFVLGGVALLEQFGKTTSDTKTPLIEEPGLFLRKAVSLWNPDTSLGELQNQAYGYLFPQGPFFLLGELAQVPAWIVERGWSVLVLLVGCEGGRLVARAMGMAPWPAWFAGMAYGLNPHVIAQVGTRSAEVLPGAVLPWVLLPIVLTMTGRLDARRAVLFSVAAFTFSGAVNGTATGAPLALVVVFLVWARRRGALSRKAVGGWFGLVALTSAWWIAALLALNAFAPPFFDYVEDARATTAVTGAASSLRGMSNWVAYTYLGGSPHWPAGFDLAYEPWLVLASGLVAAVGVLGLVTWRSAWRAPLVACAALGLALLVAGHSSWLGSPLAAPLQDLLDGPFALLRNVHKVDPVLRLPVALGVGAAFARAATARRVAPRVSVRTLPRLAAPWLVGVLTLVLAQPAVAMNLRTPGWEEPPAHWQQAAAFLAEAPGPTRAWVVPGSGFGVQTWGWTMDEPIQAVATTDWVTRSQVPLVPPSTIRLLSELEKVLESGTGSPYLGTMLARLDVGYVVVRHDLDPDLSEAPLSRLTSLAIGRSRGLERAAAFGSVGLGPAIEVYRVDEAREDQEITVTPTSDVVTVAGASSDVVQAVGRGLVDEDVATVVQGDDGWDQPADIVGDSYRDIERDFGRVHDSESHVRAEGEPSHSDRLVDDYPGNAGSRRVQAEYDEISYVDASTALSYPGVIGPLRPENSPWAAFDGDPGTGWRSSYYAEPDQQWLEAVVPEERAWHRVTVTTPVWDPDLPAVAAFRVRAGGVQQTAEVDPFTGEATVHLGGVRADRVRIEVQGIADTGPEQGPVSVVEVTSTGLAPSRTLRVPDYRLADRPTILFSAAPETRACIPTLLGPDCSQFRARPSDESTGIDRTVTVPTGGRWEIAGVAKARTTPGAMQLLDPILGTSEVVMRGSTTFEDDPGVSARFAYDGDPTTSWIADPRDPTPTLSLDFSSRRRIDSLAIARPAKPGVTPATAVIRSGKQVRRIRIADGSFAPIDARHVEITFANPTRYGAPIGLGDLVLTPDDVRVPFDGSVESGSVCGFGPLVDVDGKTHRTRAAGPLGNIASGGPVSIVPCDGPVRLRAGTHRVQVRATEQFQPVSVTLTPAGDADAPVEPAGTVRSLDVLEEESSRQVVDLGPGPESVLATGRNLNAGWVARLDGEELRVQRVDGWAQGWIVPAGEGGRVELVYAPERAYIVVLVTGLVVTGLVLLLALGVLVRTRLRPGTQPELVDTIAEQRGPGRARRLPSPLALAGCGVLAFAVSGVTAVLAAGVLAMTVLLRWPPRAVGAVLLSSAAVVAAVVLTDGPQQQVPAADVLAGAGFLVALGDLARPDRRRPGRRPRTA